MWGSKILFILVFLGTSCFSADLVYAGKAKGCTAALKGIPKDGDYWGSKVQGSRTDDSGRSRVERRSSRRSSGSRSLDSDRDETRPTAGCEFIDGTFKDEVCL
jgi:hypothetical protein